MASSSIYVSARMTYGTMIDRDSVSTLAARIANAARIRLGIRRFITGPIWVASSSLGRYNGRVLGGCTNLHFYGNDFYRTTTCLFFPFAPLTSPFSYYSWGYTYKYSWPACSSLITRQLVRLLIGLSSARYVITYFRRDEVNTREREGSSIQKYTESLQ